MVDKSNVSLRSNVMLEGRKTLKQSCPGDFAKLLWPSLCTSDLLEKNFSARQVQEYRQTRRCLTCGRACAGTCVVEED